MMQGYWKDKKSTNKTIINGWLHTGDLGSVDQNNFIKSKAENEQKDIKNSLDENVSSRHIVNVIA